MGDPCERMHMCMCCMTIGLNLVLVVILGKYAFGNPDAEAYYAEIDDAPGLYTHEELSVILQTGEEVTEFVDVHWRFRIWFTWGFCMMLLGSGYCCINF